LFKLLIMCMLISLMFPLIIDGYFINQEKSTTSLVALILVLGMIIIVSYSLVLLTEQQQRKALNRIFKRILNIKSIK